MASHSADQKTKLSLSQGFSDEQLIDALKDIFRHYGYDPDYATTAQKGEIAKHLSEVAKHEPAWGYLYVHNFMYNHIKAGKDFKGAIIGLSATIDGFPLEIIQGLPVQVIGTGKLRPGTLVFGDSQKCAYPACPIWFLPKSKRHRFHSIKCREMSKRAQAHEVRE
jgi:hypothetical protein